MRFLQLIALAMAALACAFVPACAEKRVALGADNGLYANLPLNEQFLKAVNDARAVGGALPAVPLPPGGVMVSEAAQVWETVRVPVYGNPARARREEPAKSRVAEVVPTAPSQPQTAILYEADPDGTRYIGNAIWRVERVPRGAGQNPELVIRSDIEIPAQKIAARLSLRHNDDKHLPASHTVEIQFKLPPGFPHGSIGNVPGIMARQEEATRGVALSGIAVKVKDNFFLVGLSSADAEMQSNVQLLKDRPWFDIPLVYADGKRALIAIEKGSPGERVFAEAFAAWEQLR